MEHMLLCAMLHHMFNNTDSPESKGPIPNISGACGGLEEVAKPGRNLYRAFYTFVTPVIVIVGLFGNSLCIVLLFGRELRRHRSSIFFITLAIVDICSLLFYVTVEWMDRSLALQLGASWVHWRDRPGLCQILLYLTYVFRLMAAWILVVTAAERYFGVCRPLLQKRLFCENNRKRILLGVILISCIFPIWKPLLSHATKTGARRLTCDQQEASRGIHFVLHAIYAVLLTIIPNSLILIFSILIARRLLGWRETQNACYNYRMPGRSCANGHRVQTVAVKKSVCKNKMIGAQFAILFTLISATYLLLSWPYFICWFLHFFYASELSLLRSPTQQFLSGELPITLRVTNALYVTRTFMYLTYTINFFLYSVTGRFFRRQMSHMFGTRDERRRDEEHDQIMTPYTEQCLHQLGRGISAEPGLQNRNTEETKLYMRHCIEG